MANSSNLTFIAKVVGISTALGIAIKYGGPLLSLTPSIELSLFLVFTPTIVMAGLLWRYNASIDNA